MIRPAGTQDIPFMRDMLRHAYYARWGTEADVPLERYVGGLGQAGRHGAGRDRRVPAGRSRLVPAVPGGRARVRLRRRGHRRS